MERIQQLADNVIDQIAAGEVVERPSHLVKELLENSFDAKATSISIDVAQGGRFVKVSDDGSGIHPEDLALMLKRHTTSKIVQAQDLWSLASFGFRGEALSSIASVSRLKVSSRRKGQETGYQVSSEFGREEPADEVAHGQGTTVEVTDLFENLPARLKFLKSPQAEVTAIRNLIKALALSKPSIEFRFRVEGELDLYYPKADGLLQRAQQVIGEERLILRRGERDGMRIEAVFSDPHVIQKTSKAIWFFVQGRSVQDRSLQAALLEAYRGTLMHGEFPVAVVSLDVPPAEVDVNIHPTKSQVRFLKSSTVFSFVYHTVRSGLEEHLQPQKEQGLESFSEAPSQTFSAPVPATANLAFKSHDLERVQYQKKEMHSPLSLTDLQRAAQSRNSGADESVSETESGLRSFNFNTSSSSEVRTPASSSSSSSMSPAVATGGHSANPTGGTWSRMQVLAQAHLTYLVCQSDQGLCLVDQHAAHERILFESLSQAWALGKMPAQPLLFPLAVDLSAEQIEALDTQASHFARMNLVWESLGPQTLGLTQVPAFVKESALPGLLKKVADDILDKGGSFEFEKAVHEIFSTLACHSAIRAGQALSLAEMQSLLEQMDEFSFSQFCPHGRPVSVKWSLPELEREFGRRPG